MNRSSKKPGEPDIKTRPKQDGQDVSGEIAREPEPDDRELKSKSAIKAARDFARSIAGEDKVRFIHAFQIALDIAESALRAKPDESNIFDKVKGLDIELLSERFYSDLTFVENAMRLIEDDNGIIGGTETKGRFPDCVAVGSPFTGWNCSGTLIAANAVLTARHCGGGVGQQILIGEDVNDTHAQLYNVLQAILHPIQTCSHDLTILILKDTVKGVTQALPANDNMIMAAHSVIVVGFGATEPEGAEGAGRKRMVEVPIRSYSCEGMDGMFGCCKGRELVAGDLGRDSSHSDSGGPAYVEYQGKYYLAGVTSRRAEHGGGGIYVRVDKRYDWIYEDILPHHLPK
jgi:trypsin